MDAYFPEIEHTMQRYYHSLSEKDRRRYAAIEAIKLGHGGISYISKLFDCHPKPIRRGIAELQDEQVLNEQRIRQPGGGRKRVVETMDGLSEAFLRIIEHNTAGSPVDASIKWTHLSRQQIADLLSEEAGLSVSVTVVDHSTIFVAAKPVKRKLREPIPNAMSNLRKLSSWWETTSKSAIQ